MTNQHPITPPPELVQQWLDNARAKDSCKSWMIEVATQAARWGADQELEACCEWFSTYLGRTRFSPYLVECFLSARRPKPPSLKEEALKALEDADGADYPIVATVLTAEQHALIRQALNELP